MAKNDQNLPDIKIRLNIKAEKDNPIYDSFLTIKEYLGQRLNTEVIRFCIMRAYEKLKEEGKID
ncbi:MAG: hypothetical protein ACFE8A_13425 [Candidatus Hodarchaeota archaeon]